MGILGKIFEKVLHPGRAGSPLGGSPAKAAPAPAPAAQRPAAAPQPATTAAAPRPAAAQPAPQAAPVDVEAVLSQMAEGSPQQLNWRQSIVDLLKLLDIDSSLAARKELAQELGYTGELNGSAEMNIWLHKAVMRKLAENGGKVPASLKD